MTEIVYKPYPVHIFNVPFVDAALELRNEIGASRADAGDVRIELTGAAAAYGGDFLGPFSSRDQVVGSTGYLVAAMLLKGRLGLAETEGYEDPSVLGLIGRTVVSGSPDPAAGSVSVTVAGATHSRPVAFDPSRYRASPAGVEDIYAGAVSGVLSEDRSARLLSLLRRCEEIEDIGSAVAGLLART